MPTTTNYGWTTPADTDLVKDGASAIRTLGSSIDSTLKTQIDAQIPDSLLTTTGDTIYASGASTPARLGIGSTGQILTVAGGVPTWATPAGGGKLLQVVSATTTTETTINSTTFTDTTLTATITPTSASSKILVIVSQQCRMYRATTGEQYFYLRALRGATEITKAYVGLQAAVTGGAIQLYDVTPMSYLDSPATTSATTYKTQFRLEVVGAGTVQISSYPSTITLMEIGA